MKNKILLVIAATVASVFTFSCYVFLFTLFGLNETEVNLYIPASLILICGAWLLLFYKLNKERIEKM